jgi:FMN phosphatase YigB (HAD superfamily)
MINLIFDIDDTLIIHPKGGSLDYNKIIVNQKFNYLLDFFKYPKFIYTNATYGHADIVLKNLNNKNKFQKIFARDTIPYTKPNIKSFVYVNNIINNNNKNIFFDDMLDNLYTAKILNWTTIWISPKAYEFQYNFVDYYFKDINDAMENLQYIIQQI